MSLREKSKEQNRQKILNAAKEIIQKQGVEQLSMRYLAEQAGVSLRTPYNLFGSKTDVLIALVDEPLEEFQSYITDIKTDLVLEVFFAIADRSLAYYTANESYYRGIYWEIMISEHKESRAQTLWRLEQTLLPIVTTAVVNRELDISVDVHVLNQNLVLVMIALAGLWGSGQISAQAVVNHTKYAWCTNFLYFSTRKSKPVLETLLQTIQKSLSNSLPLSQFAHKG